MSARFCVLAVAACGNPPQLDSTIEPPAVQLVARFNRGSLWELLPVRLWKLDEADVDPSRSAALGFELLAGRRPRTARPPGELCIGETLSALARDRPWGVVMVEAVG